MSVTSQPYYVQIGSGEELLCEDLGLSPLAIARANFGVDSLTLEQRQVRGEWAVALDHDVAVRFYRLKEEDDTLEQLFMGRVISPVTSVDASSRRRLVRVMGVMQLAAETYFHRGDWTPLYTSGTQSTPDYDPDQSGDECSLYYGAVYKSTTTPGRLQKNVQRQNITQAFGEAIDNLKRLAAYTSQPAVWRPVLASNYFGPTNTVPEPQFTLEGSTTNLDWMVKLARPVPDAFLNVDYTGNQPGLRVGRYGNQEPVEIAQGWPTLASATRREVDKEVSTLWVFWRVEEELGEDFPPTGGVTMRRQTARWPTSGPGNPLDRRTRILTFDDIASNDVANPATVAAFLGPPLLAPMTTGSVTLMAAAWRWCVPGSVLEVGGLRFNVQSTVLDLTTESLTASLGLPKHLGVEDLQDLSRWLRRWQRAVK